MKAKKELPQKQREVDKGKKILSDEIIKFYIHELMTAELDSFAYTLELNRKELYLRDSVRLNEFRVECIHVNDNIFSWIREYLVYAIASELENQDQLENRTKDVRIPKIYNTNKKIHFLDRREARITNFLTYATVEEIINYLKKSVARFKKPGWNRGFGGKKWARISEIALKMWQTNSPKEKYLLVDNTFQIEHHGGMIFDKRCDKISIYEDRDKEILDIKRESKDLLVLWENLRGKIKNAGTKKEIKRRLAKLSVLKNVPQKRALNGD